LSFDEYKEKELNEGSLKEGVFEYKDRGIRYKYYDYYRNKYFFIGGKKNDDTQRRPLTLFLCPMHPLSVCHTSLSLSLSLSLSPAHTLTCVWAVL
jgi:hypothetical protein